MSTLVSFTFTCDKCGFIFDTQEGRQEIVTFSWRYVSHSCYCATCGCMTIASVESGDAPPVSEQLCGQCLAKGLKSWSPEEGCPKCSGRLTRGARYAIDID